MKIAIFGASGKIGSEIVKLVSDSHEVIKIGSRGGDIQSDYTNDASVKSVFDNIEKLDSVIVCVGGDSQFKPYAEITDEDYRYGAERKLVAQFRIVRFAEQYLNDNGSITLTSGFLTDYPNPYSIATGLFNKLLACHQCNMKPSFCFFRILSYTPSLYKNHPHTILISS